MEKKIFTDGEKYLRDESIVEVHPFIVKSIYSFICNNNICYTLVKTIAYGDERQISSYIHYIIFSNHKKLRNLDENLKINFIAILII